jgi:hypothetical protein
MAAKQISRIGFGQVEANHLSAQHTGQIYAQLPCNDDIDILENGQFMKYDYANGECNFTGDGEFMLVMNEIKNYDDRYQGLKDFAYIKENFTPGSATITHEGIGPFPGYMYPRLLKTNVGDLFTTNTFGANTSNTATVQGESLDVGDFIKVGTNGYLTKTTATTFDNAVTEVAGQPLFKVVKVYTMPDGVQPGVKLQRVA